MLNLLKSASRAILDPGRLPNNVNKSGARQVFFLLILVAAAGLALLAGDRFLRWGRTLLLRMPVFWTWVMHPDEHEDWTIQAGARCGEAPFVLPTDGFIGFWWDDSFRPGHRHQGIDIFGKQTPGVNPVVAAYSGYLTRQEDWKSTVILRLPSDPLQPGRQIWLYYTHMADAQGNSFIAAQFPAGTREVFVEAGTLLGYQGNYSGSPDNPTGVHLHFSIVLDDGVDSSHPLGSYRNELYIRNTLDPSPYLGLEVNANHGSTAAPVCR